MSDIPKGDRAAAMRTYLHLDVFTDTLFAGNQLAVFLDGGGLEPEVMQKIAREMAFSETTFVMPAEDPSTDVRVRIFTPGTELPMAGHPTIGTAFAMAHERRVTPEQALVTFGLGVGPTPVRLEWRDGQLGFAWMRQAVPSFGAIPNDIDQLAAMIAVDPHEILKTNLPVQEASSGVPMLLVPMASREGVDSATPNVSAITHFFRGANMPEMPIYVFSFEAHADNATVYSRMFAPGFGIIEDPATGSACGPLGGYLFHHGVVSADDAKSMVNLQGAKMGRPSYIHISVTATELTMTDVQVGGKSILVGSGTVNI